MKLALAFALFTAALAAQPIGFGLKLGVPFNDAYNAATGGGVSVLSNEKQITIGPSVELRLPFGIAIEADLLYRRFDTTFGASEFNTGVNGHALESPVLLKYRMKFPIVRPFVVAGPTFRWSVDSHLSNACLTSTSCANILPTITENHSGAGMTIGAGLEIKALVIRISPEIRYTRYGSSAVTIGNLSSTIASASQNQAEFLLGIGF
jgi:Outer membrane protein beta-barrel domain